MWHRVDLANCELKTHIQQFRLSAGPEASPISGALTWNVFNVRVLRCFTSWRVQGVSWKQRGRDML